MLIINNLGLIKLSCINYNLNYYKIITLQGLNDIK